MISGIVYLLVFMNIYRDYLSAEWGYAGLTYRPLNLLEYSFVLLSVSFVSIYMPERILSPSGIVVWVLYIFIHIPTTAITLMISERESWNYMPSLAAMSVVMAVAGRLASHNGERMNGSLLPDKRFIVVLLGVFILFSMILYYKFRDILSFSNIEDVYFQRFVASEHGGGSIDYIRTHYANVVLSLLLVTGLCKTGVRYLIWFGLFAAVLTYMIDAGKLTLMTPVIIVGFYSAARLTRRRTYFYTFSFVGLMTMASLLITRLSVAKAFADLLLFRSIAIPAQTFAQYSDLFAARGYTYWSNVRGINLLVPPPAGYTSDPYWPSLGLIVGASFNGFASQQNSNANLFVGEGVAAAGTFGVFVIGFVLIACLQLLDRASERWNRDFAMLCTVPLALSLSNVHLSTLLLSFGGLALWVILRFYRFKSV
jgi:hypothetical protein